MEIASNHSIAEMAIMQYLIWFNPILVQIAQIIECKLLKVGGVVGFQFVCVGACRQVQWPVSERSTHLQTVALDGTQLSKWRTLLIIKDVVCVQQSAGWL